MIIFLKKSIIDLPNIKKISFYLQTINMDSEQSNQPLTNAERQKRYRGKMKNDPAFQQKNKSRNAKNYINKKAQNPDEELEKARIRKERSRAKSRIEKKKKLSPQVKWLKKFLSYCPILQILN